LYFNAVNLRSFTLAHLIHKMNMSWKQNIKK
jgi:hypothetical protein